MNSHLDVGGIPVDTGNGSAVLVIGLSDLDRGMNGNVRLTLLSGDTYGHFHLNKSSDNIYVLRIKHRLDLSVSMHIKKLIK